jgi:hypothetical protein
MAQGDAELLQVLLFQVWQDVEIDVVLNELASVLRKAQIL